MSERAVKSIADFEYAGDFTPPVAPAPDAPAMVPVTPAELAELLASARAEGVAAADARHDTETAARLETASTHLTAALGELLKLAERLDTAPLSAEAEASSRQLISAACEHIMAGQGDLFADQ